MIGFVVLGYAIYWASKGQAAGIQNKAAFLWTKFPKFVLGFLLISTLASVGFFSKSGLLAIGNLSRWAFLLTFAGVGLRTNFRRPQQARHPPVSSRSHRRSRHRPHHSRHGLRCGQALPPLIPLPSLTSTTIKPW